MSRRGGKTAGNQGPAAAHIRPNPSALAAKLDRALGFHRAGSFEAALELYDEAARAMPGNHRLWLAVAAVALDLGNLDAAGTALGKAAILFPGDAVIWVNHSGATLRGGDKVNAEIHARRALKIAPINLTALNNLARSLAGVDRAEALALASRRAAIVQPDDPMALMARVLWSAEARRPAITVAAARRGLGVLPGDRTFLSNLGAAHASLAETQNAFLAYRRALIAGPDFAPAWYNLGNLREKESGIDRAIQAHDRAILMAPDNADYQFNRALAMLLAGRFTEGFEAFEHRWRSAAQTTAWRKPGHALWDGRALSGESVMVWAEQGLGDTIQFSRYLQFIRDQGGVPLLEVQPELAPLFRFSPLAAKVHARDREALSMADFHVPMMSLPRLAASTPDSVPAPISFQKLQASRLLDSDDDVLDVGLVWAGNPKHHRDRDRSIPLEAFSPLAELPAVRLHVVQHGGARDQLKTCSFKDRLVQHPETADFLEAASLIAGLDLLITVDTAHAHLAGTLGIKTWLLLSHVPDWRWLLDRADSIWYPSMRLYRQDRSRTWAPVIARVTQDLSRLPN
jgi:tetratricopeptide (TPR) repeat protein